MKFLRLTAVLASGVVLLAGCTADGASYVVDAPAQAVSVVRQKSWPGAPWELGVVVRNDPQCQRRHRLRDVTGNVRIELYQAAAGAYILHQARRWYVVELKNCGFEQFKEDPQQPGELLGVFQARDGKFVFAAEVRDEGKMQDKSRTKDAAGG